MFVSLACELQYMGRVEPEKNRKRLEHVEATFASPGRRRRSMT